MSSAQSVPTHHTSHLSLLPGTCQGAVLGTGGTIPPYPALPLSLPAGQPSFVRLAILGKQKHRLQRVGSASSTHAQPAAAEHQGPGSATHPRGRLSGSPKPPQHHEHKHEGRWRSLCHAADRPRF